MWITLSTIVRPSGLKATLDPSSPKSKINLFVSRLDNLMILIGSILSRLAIFQTLRVSSLLPLTIVLPSELMANAVMSPL